MSYLRTISTTAMALGILVLSGCQTGWNPFQAPGTIFQQRSRASIHDPFPDNDIGPEIVGGRPREYDRPLHEPRKASLYGDTYGAGQ